MANRKMAKPKAMHKMPSPKAVYKKRSAKPEPDRVPKPPRKRPFGRPKGFI